MITARIEFNGESYDLFAEIDGIEHRVGVASTQGQGAAAINEFLIQYFTDNATPEKAAELVMANAYAGYGVTR